jgi:hypothetical protein
MTAGPTTGRATPFTQVSHIGGPALVYTDVNATGGFPDAHDLTTGAEIGQPAARPAGCLIQPRLSPDGSTYVLVQFWNDDCTGASYLWIIGLSGGFELKLGTAPANAWFDAPNWSPDGSTILYTMEQDDSAGRFVSSQLYTVPVTGGPASAIGGGGVMGFDGVYSPDGTKIAYAANIDTSANYLAIMNTDGTGVVNLPGTGLSPFSPGFPAWSPDGSRLSFQYDKAVGAHHNYGIAVVNADGTGARVLPVAAAASTDAFVSSWSADGTEIFYDAMTRSTSTGVVSAYGSIYGTDVASGAHRTTILAALSTDVFYDPFFVGPGPTTPTASTYTPVAPSRVLPRTPVGSGAYRDVQITGVAGVPSGASAVTVNLTGAAPTAATYLQLYPAPSSGNPVPLISNLNLVPGQAAAVAVQVALPPSGKLRVRNQSGTTGVIIDVSGYFTSDTTHGAYYPLAEPARVLDTAISAGTARAVNVAGLAGAPANPVAAVVNLTGAAPAVGTFESVFPTPGGATTVTAVAPPTFSSLNLTAHQTRANLVTVPIGPDGRISVYNKIGTIRSIVDVQGFYSNTVGGLAYYPLAPTRVLDTRYGTNTLSGSTAPIGPAKYLDLPLRGTTTTSTRIVTLPTVATVAVFGLTAIAPTASTYLTVYATPTTNTVPLASNLNPASGSTTPNLVISKLSDAGGTVRNYNALGNCPVLADLAGYYAPTP